ncbi:gamma-glutamyl phosphate reductase [Lactobacillus delbrueckii subsp. bulgaricus]|nr:gamma-glutamyl phosphate reductase [Lactobacillus delbrueckii subsp. bulgaricus]
MLDRLRLTPDRLAGMASGIRALVDLQDPVGRLLGEHTADNGLGQCQDEPAISLQRC